MRRILLIGAVVCALVVAVAGVAMAAPGAPTMISPTDGLIVAVGSEVLLGAKDTDATPSATMVDFVDKPGVAVLATALVRGTGDVFSAPWIVTPGVHTVVARASDGTTQSAESATTRTIRGDTGPPTTSITSPTAGSFVRGTVTISGTAADDTKVARIEVFDGTTLLTQIDSPGPTWTYAWSTGADRGVTLTARVTDAAGRSPVTSSPVSVTVDNTPPAAFSVTAVSPVTGNPTLGWSAATDAHPPVTYVVSRDGGAAMSAGTGLSFVDTGAGQGPHSYVVTAFDAAGNPRSAAAVAVTVDSSGATAPTGVSGKTPTKDSPTITWKAPAGVQISKWQVFRDGSTTPIEVPLALTTFTDTAALKDGPHSYQVRGLDLASSPLTASASFTVVLDTAPPVVAAPTATPQADGSISLTWPAVTDPAPGTGITQVYLRASGSEICSGDAALTACTDRTPIKGTSAYSLFAIDRAGNIANASVDVTVRDVVPPSQPRGLTLKVKNRIPTIAWRAAPAEDGVATWKVIQVGAKVAKPKSPTDGTPVCPFVPGTITTCTARKPLVNGVPVRFALFAIDESGNVSTPAVIAVRSQRSDRKAPIIAGGARTTIGATHTFFTLTWKRPADSDLKEFVIRWLPTRFPPGVKIGNFAYRGRATSVTLGQKPGTTRYYALFATDRSGNASPAIRIRVTMPKAVTSKPRTPGSGPVIKIN